MNFPDYFPIWDQLNQDQQDRLQNSAALRSAPRGTVLHNGDMDCTGLLLVKSGQLRAYILSDEGREITLYRPSISHMTSENRLAISSLV